jgi:hypothetical protein
MKLRDITRIPVIRERVGKPGDMLKGTAPQPPQAPIPPKMPPPTVKARVQPPPKQIQYHPPGKSKKPKQAQQKPKQAHQKQATQSKTESDSMHISDIIAGMMDEE